MPRRVGHTMNTRNPTSAGKMKANARRVSSRGRVRGVLAGGAPARRVGVVVAIVSPSPGTAFGSRRPPVGVHEAPGGARRHRGPRLASSLPRVGAVDQHLVGVQAGTGDADVRE